MGLDPMVVWGAVVAAFGALWLYFRNTNDKLTKLHEHLSSNSKTDYDERLKDAQEQSEKRFADQERYHRQQEAIWMARLEEMRVERDEAREDSKRLNDVVSQNNSTLEQFTIMMQQVVDQRVREAQQQRRQSGSR
jgi:hypothetical protein